MCVDSVDSESHISSTLWHWRRRKRQHVKGKSKLLTTNGYGLIKASVLLPPQVENKRMSNNLSDLYSTGWFVSLLSGFPVVGVCHLVATSCIVVFRDCNNNNNNNKNVKGGWFVTGFVSKVEQFGFYSYVHLKSNLQQRSSCSNTTDGWCVWPQGSLCVCI